jgi:adenylate cyclase
MGDTVNLASRLEGLNKYYGTSILMSSSTYEGWQKTLQESKLMFESPIDTADDFDTQNITYRRLEKAKVKGKSNSNLIYEILPFELNHSERISEMALYEQGYDLFVAGRFADALSVFNMVKECQAEPDNVVLKKIEMCEQFIREPPVDWDGSLKMEEK